jgi:hypothetical protein
VQPASCPAAASLASVPTSFATARFQWEDGAARLREADRADRRDLEAVVDEIVIGLRRRLGGPFTIAELIDLYDQGTDWCLDVAVGVAPENPRAWDEGTVVGAAFWRYAREATDLAGGRRLGE